MSLKIIKGGKLIETKWVYDEEIRKGQHVDCDRTDYAERHLFDNCTLDKDVTLKDIFEVFETKLSIMESIVGNWFEEIVKDGLYGGDFKIPLREYKNEYDPKGIEYLELSKFIDVTEGHAESMQIIFDGQGWELKEDIYEQEWLMHPKGTRIGWGLDFSPAYDLINIPVKLNTNLEVYSLRNKSEECTYKNQEFTLGEIIYNIIWELSFHGAPTDRDTAAEAMKKAVDQIKKEL